MQALPPEQLHGMGLDDLCRLLRDRWDLMAKSAGVFLLAGLLWTTLGPKSFEASAYLETRDAAETQTIAEQLRFLSIYRIAAGTEAGARELARDTRARPLRGTRLVEVTARHREPELAAAAANAVARSFLAWQSGGDAAVLASLLGQDQADSVNALIRSWRQHADASGILSQSDAGEVSPADRASAEERTEVLREELSLRAAELRNLLGAPEELLPSDPADALEALAARADPGLRNPGGGWHLAPSRLAEAASVPAEAAGPRPAAIWLAALALGALAGMLLIVCRGSACASA